MHSVLNMDTSSLIEDLHELEKFNIHQLPTNEYGKFIIDVRCRERAFRKQEEMRKILRATFFLCAVAGARNKESKSDLLLFATFLRIIRLECATRSLCWLSFVVLSCCVFFQPVYSAVLGLESHCLFCLSICLLIFLTVCLSVCLPVYLSPYRGNFTFTGIRSDQLQ